MAATHTLSEAQINELARAMRQALSLARDAGYAASSYVHDHNTHESILNRRRAQARSEATKATEAMWALFYDLMSRDVIEPTRHFGIAYCGSYPQLDHAECPSSIECTAVSL